jgi:hypothetical protein
LLYQELRKQGNSLNQIAKAIHIVNLPGQNIDGAAYLQMLSSIHTANREIAESIAKLEVKF